MIPCVGSTTDNAPHLGAYSRMGKSGEREVLSADRCSGGVLIVFDDGKTAVYSASLLYASLPQIAGVLDGDGPEELEET